MEGGVQGTIVWVSLCVYCRVGKFYFFMFERLFSSSHANHQLYIVCIPNHVTFLPYCICSLAPCPAHPCPQASPGNLQQLEDVLFSDGSAEEPTSCVMAISCQLSKEGLRTVGVAYYESTTLTLGVSEFVDNDSFSNLEVRSRKLYRITCLSCF